MLIDDTKGIVRELEGPLPALGDIQHTGAMFQGNTSLAAAMLPNWPKLNLTAGIIG
jgi:hypothetical protein